MDLAVPAYKSMEILQITIFHATKDGHSKRLKCVPRPQIPLLACTLCQCSNIQRGWYLSCSTVVSNYQSLPKLFAGKIPHLHSLVVSCRLYKYKVHHITCLCNQLKYTQTIHPSINYLHEPRIRQAVRMIKHRVALCWERRHETINSWKIFIDGR